MSVVEAAYRLRAAGLSPLPVAGHDWVSRWVDPQTSEVVEKSLRKAPAFMNGQGPRLFKWGELRKRFMTDEEIEKYCSSVPNIGVAFGKQSGNAECIDFDEPGFYEAWRSLLEAHGHGTLVARLTVQATQTPGHYQALYRCPEGIEGNKKLAKRPATPAELLVKPDELTKGLIETRGEGGYALVEPSEGYRVVQGSMETLPTITGEERKTLWDFARHFDAMPPEEPRVRAAREPGQPTHGMLPGDDFDRRGDWDDILGPKGWKRGRSHGRLTEWTRPGKEGRAISAHTGLGHGDIDFMVVFSTNAHPLEPTPMKYGKFRAYCVLNHGGDSSEHQSRAAKELYAEGFGERMNPKDRTADERRANRAPASGSAQGGSKTSDGPSDDHSPSRPERDGATEEEAPRLFPSRLMTIDEVLSQPDKPMLVQDLIGKQDRCMWAGAPGCGKTFGVLNLLACCALGGEFAFRFDVPRPLRVAYCSNEGRFGLKRRLSAVLEQFGAAAEDVRDYMRFVADVPQFFKPEGERGIWSFVETLEAEGFVPDVLFVDTLSKATLGSKEVDNGEAAFICDVAHQVGERLDCSTLFVHHTGWEGDRPRGASAYFGDMDVVLLQRYEQEKKAGEIKYFKGKEIEPFEPIPFTLLGMAEHRTAVIDFSKGSPLEMEMTVIQKLVQTMAGASQREWWTVRDLYEAIRVLPVAEGSKVPSREAIYSALKHHSQRKAGTDRIFDWDGNCSPNRYRRAL